MRISNQTAANSNSVLFKIVLIDTGHITLPSCKKDYFLVAGDTFTKWAEARKVTFKTGVAIANFLKGRLLRATGVQSAF